MTPRRRVSRRRFLSLLAGSAAVFASPALAASAAKPARRRPAKPAPPPPADPVEKQYQEALASTRATLDVLRKQPLPPGSPLAVVFRPLPANRKGR